MTTSCSSLPCVNVLPIASGKGGVGKTWFSLTFTQKLAEEKKRILLIDADIHMANVALQLGLNTEYNLSHFFQGTHKIQEIITQHTPNIHFISGQVGFPSHAFSHEKGVFLRESIRSLASSYDWILLDMGAGIDTACQALLPLARYVMMVITPEITSLTDGYAFIKGIQHRLPSQHDFHVVVNMAESKKEAQETFNVLQISCEKFLNLPLIYHGFIHRDTKVRKTIRQQDSFWTLFSDSRTADHFMKIVQNFLNRMHG